ncbi:hypothetical protein BH10PSE7_BH10PSE7_35190 [soil metagenome]
MKSVFACTLVLAIGLTALSAESFGASKKKAKPAKHEMTRAEIYEHCKRLIHKVAGASTSVYRVRRLSTGKIICYYAW